MSLPTAALSAGLLAGGGGSVAVTTTATTGTSSTSSSSSGTIKEECVDYLSYKFDAFDLHQCWKYSTKYKDTITNGRRWVLHSAEERGLGGGGRRGYFDVVTGPTYGGDGICL